MKTTEASLSTEIGRLLRRRRKTLGLAQADLAAQAGVSVHTLSDLESGKGNPSLDVLERLFDYLGLRVVIEPRGIQTADDL
jgi:y4mF family transcriptional regulator